MSKPLSFWLTAFLAASTQSALAQQCPPNSHPVAVAIPGNLRTAQCFCNAGYVPVAGACVRANPTRRPHVNDPARSFVQPR